MDVTPVPSSACPGGRYAGVGSSACPTDGRYAGLEVPGLVLMDVTPGWKFRLSRWTLRRVGSSTCPDGRYAELEVPLVLIDVTSGWKFHLS
ncbi:hypothetical protein RRG08_054308 [Elysia crispata]|uniref:Uncharacterized protein n=1 Tax=Elysia crispata TaxID=231223 RepID=A0AAE1E728_9GAST|nr:hypothetical protein RRG08_054308 [Elysia crispata]